jgi:hypothetical protein
MKRTVSVVAALLVVAVAWFGIRARGAGETPSSNVEREQPQAAAPTPSRSPRLARTVLAPAATEEPAANPRLAQSLAAVEREAQEIATALAQERNPEKRARLEQYAEAIEQIRDGLR